MIYVLINVENMIYGILIVIGACSYLVSIALIAVYFPCHVPNMSCPLNFGDLRVEVSVSCDECRVACLRHIARTPKI